MCSSFKITSKPITYYNTRSSMSTEYIFSTRHPGIRNKYEDPLNARKSTLAMRLFFISKHMAVFMKLYYTKYYSTHSFLIS